jgi:hypothetical protein
LEEPKAVHKPPRAVGKVSCEGWCGEYGQEYLKRTKWQSSAWDHALMPPSGGGGIGSPESFVLRRERVFVKTPPSAVLL